MAKQIQVYTPRKTNMTLEKALVFSGIPTP